MLFNKLIISLKNQTCLYIIFLILGISISDLSKGQNSAEKPDSLTYRLNEFKSDISLIKKLKITGYFQAQAQFADSAGIESFEGGAFPANVDKRFALRRGRLKFTYTGLPLNTLVFQIDATEKSIYVKDAYLKFTEPLLKSFSLTGGIFNRPFGFENEYSSSVRESPERSRTVQTLLPGERDVGFMLTFQPPKTSGLHFLKLDAAIVNGNGSNGFKSDFDNYKDFIGHLSVNKSFSGDNIIAGAGLSYYNGGIGNATSRVFYLENDAFIFNPADTLTNLLARSERELAGVDAQFALKNPLGVTTLRGEIITGHQASYAKSTVSPNLLAASDTYLRNVRGYYIYIIQNLFKTRHQLVIKYDVYDPNVNISGSQVGAPGSGTTLADIRYNTLGIGWNYQWDSNIKISAYYAIVHNESTLLNEYTKDIKDNVLTIRAQYKF